MLENFNNDYIINEKNLNYGDFVIAFPNPDCEDYDKLSSQKYVNFIEALKIFNRSFLFDIK